MKQVLITILLIFAMTGAVGAAKKDGPIHDTQVIEGRADIAALVSAAALEMQGQSVDSHMVTFSSSARDTLRSDGFNLPGFGKPRFLLLRFAESESDQDQTEVGVVMSFVDPLLRRAAISMLLTCRWADDGKSIAVDSATVDHITPPEPEMVLTIVPANRVPKDLLATRTHAELLPWIIENRATEEELYNGDADECYLFAFTHNRLAPDASLEILVDDDPEGTRGDAGSGEDYDYGGWHVAVLRGRFDWDGDEAFYVKVVHTRPEDPRNPRLLGVLSSELEPVHPGDRKKGRQAPEWLTDMADGTMTIISIVLLAVGLLVSLMGYKLGRAFLAFMGLLFGAFLGLVVILLTVEGCGSLDAAKVFLEDHEGLIPVAVSLVLIVPALVFAVVFAVIRWLGMALLGATVGAGIGLAITGGVDVDNLASPVVLVAAAVLAIGVPFVRKASTIVSSAALGASFVALGLAQLLGDWDVRESLFPEDPFEGRALIALVAAGVVFLVGAVLQFIWTRSRPEQAAPSPEASGPPAADQV